VCPREPLERPRDVRTAAVHDDRPQTDGPQEQDVPCKKECFSDSLVIAAPPYLMTQRCPLNRSMYPNASTNSDTLKAGL